MMKNLEDRKDLFFFSHLCLVREMEMWRDEKLFYLIKEKSNMIENKICINLLSCPY